MPCRSHSRAPVAPPARDRDCGHTTTFVGERWEHSIFAAASVPCGIRRVSRSGEHADPERIADAAAASQGEAVRARCVTGAAAIQEKRRVATRSPLRRLHGARAGFASSRGDSQQLRRSSNDSARRPRRGQRHRRRALGARLSRTDGSLSYALFGTPDNTCRAHIQRVPVRLLFRRPDNSR